VPYLLFMDLDHDLANKVLKNSIKLKKSKVFLIFFCLLMEGSETWAGSGAVQIHTDRDPGGPSTYGSGSKKHSFLSMTSTQLEMLRYL
jgi:hypothetical protein